MTVSVVLVALASAGAAGASCPRPGMIHTVTLTSGHLHGTPWSLRAIDSGDGRYCFDIILAGSRRAGHCGRFYVRGPNGAPVQLGWTSVSHGSGQTFVAGAVAEAARRVSIRLSDSSVRTVATIPPGCLLAPGISFFFAPTPPATSPTTITARDASGRIVVRWKRPAK